MKKKKSRFGATIVAIAKSPSDVTVEGHVGLIAPENTPEEEFDFNPVELTPDIEALLLEFDRLKSPEVKTGRPSKLNGRTVRTLAEAIIIGATYLDACNSVGIRTNTFTEWMKAGEKPANKKYSLFNEIIQLADSTCAVRMARILHDSARNNDPKYALEWLKRRRKLDWSERTDIVSDSHVEIEVIYTQPGDREPVT